MPKESTYALTVNTSLCIFGWYRSPSYCLQSLDFNSQARDAGEAPLTQLPETETLV